MLFNPYSSFQIQKAINLMERWQWGSPNKTNREGVNILSFIFFYHFSAVQRFHTHACEGYSRLQGSL